MKQPTRKLVMLICAVRDLAMQAYMRPFFTPTEGVAIRSFQDEVNREGSEMQRHPADYELYSLGEFDEETGLLVSHSDGPRLMFRAVQAVVPKEA